jgi:deoxycytidylate deaminase
MRLIGEAKSTTKYAGVERSKVIKYIERDEKDQGKRHGQQVRDAFYLGDFFIDNNLSSQGGELLNSDLDRFKELLLGSGLVRPTQGERAMYHAHAAALQSSCLSRQVGAALMTTDGTVVSTGTNDVPKFGGGVYDEDSEPEDHRCFHWNWTNGKENFIGCHNQRKKMLLRRTIAGWIAENWTEKLAEIAHPKPVSGLDTAAEARKKAAENIFKFFEDSDQLMDDLPGIKDIVEYSRSIHAEMNALFAVARNGVSPRGYTLFCTTYPCHNCARHLVTAGVYKVFYIEPYVKSLATELHSDSIATEAPRVSTNGQAPATRMIVTPFTGVGPRMYEDFFTKRSELKKPDGSYDPPDRGRPAQGVRLGELQEVEDRAASLVPEKNNG